MPSIATAIRRATPSASAVSVLSGRCGPCCSSAPTGSTAMAPPATASPASGQVAVDRSSIMSSTPRCRGRPAAPRGRAVRAYCRIVDAATPHGAQGGARDVARLVPMRQQVDQRRLQRPHRGIVGDALDGAPRDNIAVVQRKDHGTRALAVGRVRRRPAATSCSTVPPGNAAAAAASCGQYVVPATAPVSPR